MILSAETPVHLTYCLNIHPGETWPENFAAIRDHAMAVRERVAPGRRFGLGLRLSRRAADELAEPEQIEAFGDFLAANDLYVFTINGFPYGPFHGSPVKESVYRPDWRTEERRDYTVRLIDILARLLPDGVVGSISTVPGAYKPALGARDDVERMCRMLADAVAHAARVRGETGREIVLALEPEPDCFIETTDEAVAFFTGDLPAIAGPRLAGRAGVPAGEAESVLARHLGVCFDTAHAAVQFESLAESLGLLGSAGVRVGKVQLSAALRLRPTPAALRRLRDFADPVYLHQVRRRRGDGTIEGFADLGDALAAAERADPAGDELRVHFHVPLFFGGTGWLESTGELLTAEVWRLLVGPASLTQHLEIETYTFDVLPEPLRCGCVEDSIAREFAWVGARLPAGADGAAT